MATVARAEPSSVVATLADGDAPQVGAHSQHDEPFGLLRPCFIGLGIAESLDVDGVCFFDFLRRTVSNEYGLATPFNNDVLA